MYKPRHILFSSADYTSVTELESLWFGNEYVNIQVLSAQSYFLASNFSFVMWTV
jgi:hypothetical protein